ncbi:MAG: HAD family hydrolase [Gammaproteobacteria bacterium]
MALALFDLDNTLLAGDSDYLWGEYLVEHEKVDANEHARKNQYFYQQYLDGSLDIHEFLDFQLKPLAMYSRKQLESWRQQFMEEKIQPIMLATAHTLIKQHRDNGDTLVIITATNRFITEPIATAYGIDHLLATEAEMINGEYTGGTTGIACFQQGKVERLHDWLKQHNASLEGSWFYSDSHNDLPLLELVDHPIAVDPDEKLRSTARLHGWPVMSLRTE